MEEALEIDGELNHIQTGRNGGGRAARWAAFCRWGLRYYECEQQDREIWRQSFCQSIRGAECLTLIMSFGGDERAKMGGRSLGEMRGWGQSLTKSSLALQSDPASISADFIRLLSHESGWCVLSCHDTQTSWGTVSSHAGRKVWDDAQDPESQGCLLIWLL